MFTVKKSLVVFLLGCVLSFGVNVVGTYAEEGILENIDLPIEVTADIAFNSKYIWRGFLLDDDAVMQEGVYVSGYGFTISAWGSFDIDADDTRNSDEVDYSVDYTHEFEKLSVSLGHTYYDFPPADTASKEYYIGVGLKTLLSPSLTWYHDYADEDSGGGNGDYIVLEAGHSLALGQSPITLDLSTHIAYNDELFINGQGGDANLGIGLTIPLTQNCSVSPAINYSIPFDDLEDSADGNQEEEFYGGLTFAFSM